MIYNPNVDLYNANVYTKFGLNKSIRSHCGESKTQRKWFLDEKRDGLVDENIVNNKKNKNNRAVFMLYLFAYNIKPMPK